MHTTIAQAVSRRTVLLALAAGMVLGGQAVWSSADGTGSLVATMGGISGAGQSDGDIRTSTDPILTPGSVGALVEASVPLEAGVPSGAHSFDASSFDASRGLIRRSD